MRTNSERAEKARKILDREYNEYGPQESLIDILDDLKHLAFVAGLNWTAAVRWADEHFREEIDEAAELEDERQVG